MLDVPFYVSTNNKHMRCLEAFVQVFNHFIPEQELRILGYNSPDFNLPSNCKFISMGQQGPVQEWSTDLRKYFLSSGEDHFIYGTEDVFFYKKPQVSYINYLINLLKSDSSIGRINLVDATEDDNTSLENSPHYRVNLLREVKGTEWGDFRLYQQRRDSRYAITTQLSIWNKNFMLEYLVEGMSPWDFERYGSLNARGDNKYKILMLSDNYPINKREGYSKGRWTNVNYWRNFISDDIKRIVGNGV